MNKDFEKFISGNWKAKGKCTAWINFFFFDEIGKIIC